MKHLFLLYAITFTLYSTSLQGMFDENDLTSYTNLLKQENNEALKIPSCVLFSYNIDKINNKVIYTLYKQVCKSNESPKVNQKVVDFLKTPDQKSIIQNGKLFLDPDATLEYPDTIETRNDPIKNIVKDWYLYKDGNIIFKISSSFVNIFEIQFYPTDILKNVTKKIYHNGWYQEQIYPDIKKDRTAYYFTWQHKTYLSIQYVCELLIVLYTFKKIKPHLPF